MPKDSGVLDPSKFHHHSETGNGSTGTSSMIGVKNLLLLVVFRGLIINPWECQNNLGELYYINLFLFSNGMLASEIRPTFIGYL